MYPEGEKPEVPVPFQQAFELPGDPTFSPDFPAPEITAALPVWKDKAEKEELTNCAYIDLNDPRFIHTFNGTSWDVTGMQQRPRSTDPIQIDGLLVKSSVFRISRIDLFQALDSLGLHMRHGAPLVVHEPTSESENNSIAPRERTLQEHGFELLEMHGGENILVWEGRRINNRAELELLIQERPMLPRALLDHPLTRQLPQGKILSITTEHPHTARLLDRNKGWKSVSEDGKELAIDPNKRDSRRIAGVIVEVSDALDGNHLPRELVAKAGSWIRRTGKRDQKGSVTDEHLGVVYVVGEKGEVSPTKKELAKMFHDAGLTIDQESEWVYEDKLDDGRTILVAQARAHKLPRPMPDFVREKLTQPKLPAPGDTRVLQHTCGKGGCQEHLVETYYSEPGRKRNLLFRDTSCPKHGLKNPGSGHEYVRALDLLQNTNRTTPRPRSSRGHREAS